MDSVDVSEGACAGWEAFEDVGDCEYSDDDCGDCGDCVDSGIGVGCGGCDPCGGFGDVNGSEDWVPCEDGSVGSLV